MCQCNEIIKMYVLFCSLSFIILYASPCFCTIRLHISVYLAYHATKPLSFISCLMFSIHLIIDLRFARETLTSICITCFISLLPSSKYNCTSANSISSHSHGNTLKVSSGHFHLNIRFSYGPICFLRCIVCIQKRRA